MKTLIAVPCMDQVAAPFAQSLATIQNKGDCIVSFNIGSLIYDGRNQLARQALQLKADYILWLDSDMMFPQDVLAKMLQHMEDGKNFVSGLYFRRRAPFTPVIFKKLSEGEPAEDYNDYPENSVFEIAGAGFGCCMTRVSMLEDILLNEHDWFTPIGRYGEDVSFCIRAARQGYKLYCDSSLKCGHVGQVIVDEAIYKANFREASDA
ncbi:MAG: glycosyltransferase family 2 protein [Oscillospiraceae bacterium]|nr:glycosyltransferase family 2 protein [Oscillospiraceae bacterium]